MSNVDTTSGGVIESHMRHERTQILYQRSFRIPGLGAVRDPELYLIMLPKADAPQVNRFYDTEPARLEFMCWMRRGELGWSSVCGYLKQGKVLVF